MFRNVQKDFFTISKDSGKIQSIFGIFVALVITGNIFVSS